MTRLTDKRKIRRDISDVFCTKAEGFRARDAKKYNLIDGSFPRSKWEQGIKDVAQNIVDETESKKGDVTGVTLPTITSENSIDGDKQNWSYEFVKVEVEGRQATLHIFGPNAAPERSPNTWSLKVFSRIRGCSSSTSFQQSSCWIASAQIRR